MEHIDTVLAANLTEGDVIETWDEDKNAYVHETVTLVEDDEAGSHVIVYTEENPDEGWSFFWDQVMRLFGP